MILPFEISKIRAWLREAGAIALDFYQSQFLYKSYKSDHSPVTEADKAVEAFLVDKIKQAYLPYGHGLIAEESGGEGQEHEFVWAVDPIDGTRIFADGLPMWGIAIGLLRNGEPYRGAVYLPALNEIYYTNDEGRPFWNDQPLGGRLRTDWDEDSFIAVPSAAHRHYKIDFRRMRALGAIATHHLLVARGAAVAALHRQASIWDIAGAHAILSAAGGIAVYLDGRPLALPEILAKRQCRETILVGHPAVVERLLPRIEVRSQAAKTKGAT